MLRIRTEQNDYTLDLFLSHFVILLSIPKCHFDSALSEEMELSNISSTVFINTFKDKSDSSLSGISLTATIVTSFAHTLPICINASLSIKFSMHNVFA